MRDFIGLLAAIIGLITASIGIANTVLQKRRAQRAEPDGFEESPARSQWYWHILRFFSAFGGGWISDRFLFEISQGESLPAHQIQGLRSMTHSIAPLVTLLICGFVAVILLNRSSKIKPISALWVGVLFSFVVLSGIAYVDSLQHV